MPTVFDQSEKDCLKYCRHSIWWRRGESNPCPKTHPQGLLRAQTVIAGDFLSPFPSGKASRHAFPSGELHYAWYGQSLPYARAPLSDARIPARGPSGSDDCLN